MGYIGDLSRGSIHGFSPQVAQSLGSEYEISFLDHRGKEELTILNRVETERKERTGCVNAVLGLPVLKEIRGILPQDWKRAVKDLLKSWVLSDNIEP